MDDFADPMAMHDMGDDDDNDEDDEAEMQMIHQMQQQ